MKAPKEPHMSTCDAPSALQAKLMFLPKGLVAGVMSVIKASASLIKGQRCCTGLLGYLSGPLVGGT